MTPAFKPGDTVVVANRDHQGHMRTPLYIRGKSGVVERICGNFRNPETLGYGGDGLPKRPLYRVRFQQSSVWPGYAGAPADTVDVELYEHWLEPPAEREPAP